MRKRSSNWAKKQYEKHLRHNRLFAKPGTHECLIILDNLKRSFNIGKIFRSADAFGAHEIHLIGIDYFPSKAAKGSFKWVPAVFHDSFEECYGSLESRGYSLYILEPGAEKQLGRLQFPQKSGFIFGHEEHGISFDRGEYPAIESIAIPQYGRVDSLNVSVAASVVMYEYARQMLGG